MPGKSRLTDRLAASKHTLTRRGYARVLAGATLAAAGLSTGSVARTDYETIEARGQLIELEDGETFENVLVDLTTGEGITIYARQATDWTIRNVGFRGRYRGDGFIFGISDRAGGESRLENVYLGDGADMGGESFVHGPGAIFLGPEHAGHVDIRNVAVREYTNNAFYCSNGAGTVHIDRCYAADNGVANFRLNADGDRVTDSCAYGSGDVPNGNYRGRGVWAWNPGEIAVEGCQLAMNGTGPAIAAGASHQPSTVVVSETDYDEAGGIIEANGSTVSLEDDVDTDPEPVLPEGCPADPGAAATGD